MDVPAGRDDAGHLIDSAATIALHLRVARKTARKNKVTALYGFTKDLRLSILTHSLLNLAGAILSFGVLLK